MERISTTNPTKSKDQVRWFLISELEAISGWIYEKISASRIKRSQRDSIENLLFRYGNLFDDYFISNKWTFNMLFGKLTNF